MIEEREELMVSPHQIGDERSTLRKNAHFLKPTFDSKVPLPEPPSDSLTSRSNISLLKSLVSFKGRSVPLKNWVTWVGTLRESHQDKWKQVGIFDAIIASTCNITNYNELIIALAEKWCPETNTFVFSFGEATVTLEDVMMLGGYSVLGECVRFLNQSSEVEEITREMMSFFSNATTVVRHSGWIDYFTGLGGESEHVAFLVLWLSRYVFPTQSFDYISPHVFAIAISLARGTRIALAPAVLASIYRDLRLLKAKIVDFVAEGKDYRSNLFLWAPLHLVQVWVWERFMSLSPKPTSLHSGEPRVARWLESKKRTIRLIRFEFESGGECFLWKPYALYVTDKKFSEFYCDDGKSVVMNSKLSDQLVSFARCLRPCELIGLDCIEQYLPHRVGMQFGFDQHIPCPISRSNQSVELAWSSYSKPLDGRVLYLPPRLLRGEVTTRYVHWWGTKSYQCITQRRRRSERIAKTRSSVSEIVSKRQRVVRAEKNTPINEPGEGSNQVPENDAPTEPWNINQMSNPIDDPIDIRNEQNNVEDCLVNNRRDEVPENSGYNIIILPGMDTEMQNNVDEPLIIEDDDDDDNKDDEGKGVRAINMMCLDFDDRISKLEAIFSKMKAAAELRFKGSKD